jgi:hypothetical protein
MKEKLKKIPKWATIWILFYVVVYFYDKWVIWLPELTFISNIAMILGVGGSALSRYYGKK